MRQSRAASRGDPRPVRRSPPPCRISGLRGSSRLFSSDTAVPFEGTPTPSIQSEIGTDHELIALHRCRRQEPLPRRPPQGPSRRCPDGRTRRGLEATARRSLTRRPTPAGRLPSTRRERGRHADRRLWPPPPGGRRTASHRDTSGRSGPARCRHRRGRRRPTGSTGPSASASGDTRAGRGQRRSHAPASRASIDPARAGRNPTASRQTR